MADPAAPPTAPHEDVVPQNVVPQNVVVVLLDSLNRHMLGAYGGRSSRRRTSTASRSTPTRFTNHVTGSLPCMPARHDILCGSLDFLWRPVGLDRAVGGADHGHAARRRGDDDARHRSSAPVRDRRRELPHRLRRLGLRPRARGRPVAHRRRPVGVRDALHATGVPAPSTVAGSSASASESATPKLGRRPTTDSRTWFRAEDDFPGPRTMSAAARGCATSAAPHDRWMLFVDEFDPHEPFDTPEPWTSMYDDEPWDGDRLIWPPYVVGGIASGALTRAPRPPHPRQLRRQAVDDRPLVRRGRRRARRATAVGHDRGDRVHRPRPLPRRRSTRRAVRRGRGDRHLGQAGRPAVRAARPHAAAHPLARRVRRATSTRSPPTSTSTPRSPTSSVSTPAHRTHGRRWCRCSPARPRRSASGRSAACSATGCRSPTAGASTPAPRRPTTSR